MVLNFNLKNGFFFNPFPAKRPLSSFVYKMEKQKYDKNPRSESNDQNSWVDDFGYHKFRLWFLRSRIFAYFVLVTFYSFFPPFPLNFPDFFPPAARPAGAKPPPLFCFLNKKPITTFQLQKCAENTNLRLREQTQLFSWI